MTAVPTRSTAHRALAHWDETGGNLPHAACAWVRVSMYSCTYQGTYLATHNETMLVATAKTVSSRNKQSRFQPRPTKTAGEQQLDGRGGRTRASQQTMHQPLVPDPNQVEPSGLESSYWPSSTPSPAAHRAYKSNSISTATVSTSPVVPRSGLPTIDGSPHCSSSRPCHSSLNAHQVCC